MAPRVAHLADPPLSGWICPLVPKCLFVGLRDPGGNDAFAVCLGGKFDLV